MRRGRDSNGFCKRLNVSGQIGCVLDDAPNLRLEFWDFLVVEGAEFG